MKRGFIYGRKQRKNAAGYGGDTALPARSGLSQRELAERAGFSRSQYAYYEVGKILPDLFSLKKIAEALKVDISALFSPERDAGVAE